MEKGQFTEYYLVITQCGSRDLQNCQKEKSVKNGMLCVKDKPPLSINQQLTELPPSITISKSCSNFFKSFVIRRKLIMLLLTDVLG